jgi:hypothetical protein
MHSQIEECMSLVFLLHKNVGAVCNMQYLPWMTGRSHTLCVCLYPFHSLSPPHFSPVRGVLSPDACRPTNGSSQVR